VNKSGYGGISIASDYELIPIQKMRNESPRRKCGRSESVRGMHDYSSFPSYFLSCKHEGIDDSHIYNHLCHGLRLLLITIQRKGYEEAV